MESIVTIAQIFGALCGMWGAFIVIPSVTINYFTEWSKKETSFSIVQRFKNVNVGIAFLFGVIFWASFVWGVMTAK